MTFELSLKMHWSWYYPS